MKTYLPYPNFAASVEVYDAETLRYVKSSVLNLLEILHETDLATDSDERHPEILKWKFSEVKLCEFAFELSKYNDGSVSEASYSGRISYHMQCASDGEFSMSPPSWWGEIDFHKAEQAELLRSNYPHYSQHFKGVSLLNLPGWAIFDLRPDYYD